MRTPPFLNSFNYKYINGTQYLSIVYCTFTQFCNSSVLQNVYDKGSCQTWISIQSGVINGVIVNLTMSTIFNLSIVTTYFVWRILWLLWMKTTNTKILTNSKWKNIIVENQNNRICERISMYIWGEWCLLKIAWVMK